MSYFVHGGNLEYQDYLTAKTFVSDVKSTILGAGTRLGIKVERQTRELIASQAALEKRQIVVTQAGVSALSSTVQAGIAELSSTVSEGLENLSFELQEVAAGITRLDATFHWGFTNMLARLGGMNVALEELIKIAKTPAQTAAYEQFEIARDAFDRHLYPECLDALEKAINGDHTSAGYKLEWRFHQLLGVIRLGFVGGDLDIVDLRKAEESFSLAARYASSTCPGEAASSYLSAGWAAYCQGRFRESMSYLEASLKIDQLSAEALFLSAKVSAAAGKRDEFQEYIRRCLQVSPLHSIKAAGDGDIMNIQDDLQAITSQLSNEKASSAREQACKLLDEYAFLNKIRLPKFRPCLDRALSIINCKSSIPLLDSIDLLEEVEALRGFLAKKSNGVFAEIIRNVETTAEVNTVRSRTKKKVDRIIVRPKKLFRREKIEEKETEVRVMELVPRKLETRAMDIGFKSFDGHMLTTIEFVIIPPGTYGRRDGTALEVTRPYCITVYPITYGQWISILPDNHSKFNHVREDKINVPMRANAVMEQQFLCQINENSDGIRFRLAKVDERSTLATHDPNGLYLVAEIQESELLE